MGNGEVKSDAIAMKNHETKLVRISCEASPGPGLAWLIIVEFRALSRGFSVWSYANNIMTDRPKWIRVGSYKDDLNWRAAYRALLKHEDLRVFGDFWADVSVDGVPDWAANVMRLAFVVDDEGAYDYRAMGDLLVGFTDAEIQSVCSCCNHEVLNTIASGATLSGMIGQTLAQIRKVLDLDPAASFAELAEVLEERAGQILYSREQERILSFIQRFPPRNSRGTEAGDRIRFREWEVLANGSRPDSLEHRLQLLSCWLSEKTKPTADNVSGSIRSTSEWPVLSWLLGGDDEHLATLLVEFYRREPDGATAFAKEVMQLGKREAYYFEGPNRFHGWAQNVIGKHIHRRNTEFALRFQLASDNAGIPIDASIRIGDLPYLNPAKERSH